MSLFGKNRLCVIGILLMLVLPTSGWGNYNSYAEHPRALIFIDEMVSNDGYDRQALMAIFSQVKYKENIIKSKSNPAEAKAWKDYRRILVTPQRVAQGLKFWNEHQATLARAESVYGVPAEIIVAIIGVETRYGRVTGRHRVIDSLSTLAFDYPKSQSRYFRGELRSLFILAAEEGVSPLELKGSYAGAMGYGQFMPSSYLHYAVDFDNDGLRDIWKNPVDAIGSVANYFSRHGWQQNGPVTSPASVTGVNFREYIVTNRKDLKPRHTLGTLINAGFVPSETYDQEQLVTAMALKGVDGEEFWVGLHNFYVITRYNHSALYAMAVFQLGQELAKKYHDDK
jgi:membrane-bound lytic murein transglycosylase B